MILTKVLLFIYFLCYVFFYELAEDQKTFRRYGFVTYNNWRVFRFWFIGLLVYALLLFVPGMDGSLWFVIKYAWLGHAIYINVMDAGMGEVVAGSPYYIGSTSKWDQFLWRVYAKYFSKLSGEKFQKIYFGLKLVYLAGALIMYLFDVNGT